MFYANQFGFRRNYSTEYAILKITDKIQRSIDEHDYSLGIFLDFSKAFDTVNHEILIEKLNYYGIRGLPSKWFTWYLSDRQQIT
jgi:retron-type reverse transcriptase